MVEKIVRGDICLVAKTKDKTKLTPMLVVSNNTANHHSPVLLCASMSKGTKRYNTQALVHCNNENAIVYCDQITSVDRSRIFYKVGTLSKEDMLYVNKAIAVSLNLDNFHHNFHSLRGKIVYIAKGQGITGSEQNDADRPAVIVSSDLVNKTNDYLNYEVVFATTRSKNLLPTHVSLPAAQSGFRETSTLLCEQVKAIPKKNTRIVSTYKGSMDDVNHALKIALGLTNHWEENKCTTMM